MELGVVSLRGQGICGPGAGRSDAALGCDAAHASMLEAAGIANSGYYVYSAVRRVRNRAKGGCVMGKRRNGRGRFTGGLLAFAALSAMLVVPAGASPADVPERPGKPRAVSVAHDSVSIEWDASTDDTVTGWVVLRRNLDRRLNQDFAAIADISDASQTSLTDSDIYPHGKFAYRLQARNANGLSARSKPLRVTIPAAPQITYESSEAAQAGKTQQSDDGAQPGERGHNGGHDASGDITLVFDSTDTGLDANLTGSASDYDVLGLHMDDDHVYLMLDGPTGGNSGLFAFDRDSGDISARQVAGGTSLGLAGASSKLYSMTSNACYMNVLDSTATNLNAVGDDEYAMAACDDDTSLYSNVYAVGDVLSNADGDSVFTLAYKHTEIDTTLSPRIASFALSDGSADTAVFLDGAMLSGAGVTTAEIETADHATDGSLLFVENGEGNGAVAFELDLSGAERRVAYKDVSFGSGHDGLFFDGDKLWTVHLNSLDTSADTLVLRPFNVPAAPPAAEVATVTSADFRPRLRHEIRVSDSVFGIAELDLNGDGTINCMGADACMWAIEGFRPSGLWGTEDYLIVSDAHTSSVWMLDRDSLNSGTLSVSEQLLDADDFFHPGLTYNYRSPNAVHIDGDTLYVSDTATSSLIAWNMVTDERTPAEDIVLRLGGCLHIAWGVWGDGSDLWVSAMASGHGCSNSRGWKMLKVDLSTKAVTAPSGFSSAGTGGIAGIWSDGTTLWANADNGVFAYNLADGTRAPEFDIDIDRSWHAEDMWSDGVHMYLGTQTGYLRVYKIIK